MQEPTLTLDTQAVLLLCGRFAPREPVQPLEPGEYNAVVEALRKRQLRPANLLDGSFDTTDWMAARVEPARAEQLLARRMALGLATERWSNGGLWVISRSDDVYPQRLRQHLGRSAPPLLWGVGDLDIPNSCGIAIVGSRDLDDEAAKWAEDLAAECARQDLTVVSGGARGVDQIAMAAALGAGGRVVAVLPEGLGKPSVVAKYREAVLDGRMLLLSPFYPDAGFSVGSAMGRNKVIYGLAEAAAIVRADANKGGTWAGAEEELRRENRIPLYVRAVKPIADGNRALIARGAQPFPDGVPADLRAVFFGRPEVTPAVPLPQPEIVMDSAAPVEPMQPASEEPIAAVQRCTDTVQPASIYDAVLPLVLATFKDPLPMKGAAAKLEVKDAQLKLWVDRAVEQGLIQKVKGRPAKFRTVAMTRNDAAVEPAVDGSRDEAASAGAIAQASLFGTKGND